MMGEFLNSVLVMTLGFAYPALECFKTLEKNRVNMNDLRFWCQYWIIVAILAIFERFGDILISWVPMYAELKLGFIIYLWYPRTKGTSYIYERLLRPFVVRHETDIEKHLRELRLRSWDVAIYYWHNCTELGQGAYAQVIQHLMNPSSKLKGGDNKKNNFFKKDQPKGGEPPSPPHPPPALPRDFVPSSPLRLSYLDQSNQSSPRHRASRSRTQPEPSAPPAASSQLYRSVGLPRQPEFVELDDIFTMHTQDDMAQGLYSFAHHLQRRSQRTSPNQLHTRAAESTKHCWTDRRTGQKKSPEK